MVTEGVGKVDLRVTNHSHRTSIYSQNQDPWLPGRDYLVVRFPYKQ